MCVRSATRICTTLLTRHTLHNPYPKVSPDTIVQSHGGQSRDGVSSSNCTGVRAMPVSRLQEKSESHNRPRRGLRACDQPLAPGREPPLGAHIVSPRQWYAHHGIYVGRGRVVQYGGLSRGLRRGPVEEVALLRFSRGRPVWIRTGELGWMSRPDVARRARSRLGENRYHILTNNCEHFCEWCVRGEHRSYQVDSFLGLYGGAAQKLIGALLRMILGLNTGDISGLASRS